MSDEARSVSEALDRLSRRDPTLDCVYLFSNQLTDAQLGELVDCLLAHPDVVTSVYLDSNQLTDETGIKLARYVAANSTIETLDLSNNQLGSGTYLALAAASPGGGPGSRRRGVRGGAAAQSPPSGLVRVASVLI